MSNLKLREVIKAIRQCKTAAEERGVVSQESALIRNAFKVNLIKLIISLFFGVCRKKSVIIEIETSLNFYSSICLGIRPHSVKSSVLNLYLREATPKSVLVT